MQLSEAELSTQSQQLQAVLRGCLSTNSIRESEQELLRLSQHPVFFDLLCYLVSSSDRSLLPIVTTTLKNYILARYNSNEARMNEQQKHFLRTNLFKLFYQVYPESAPTKVFKEIMHIVILVDFPWQGLHEMLTEDLDNGSVVAAVYFFRQVAKSKEYTFAE